MNYERLIALTKSLEDRVGWLEHKMQELELESYRRLAGLETVAGGLLAREPGLWAFIKSSEKWDTGELGQSEDHVKVSKSSDD